MQHGLALQDRWPISLSLTRFPLHKLVMLLNYTIEPVPQMLIWQLIHLVSRCGLQVRRYTTRAIQHESKPHYAGKGTHLPGPMPKYLRI